jgi:hypothetical protein
MSRAVDEKGRVLEVVDLQVVGPDSKTVEFELSDGAKVIFRFTVQRVWRAIGEYNPIGEPVYGAEVNPTRSIRNIPAEFCIAPEKVEKTGKKGKGVEGYA